MDDNASCSGFIKNSQHPIDATNENIDRNKNEAEDLGDEAIGEAESDNRVTRVDRVITELRAAGGINDVTFSKVCEGTGSDVDDSDMYHQVYPLKDDLIGFKSSTPGIKTRRGLSRYKKGLKNAIPIRTTKAPTETLPLETNGLVNYITFGWLSPYMWTVFKNGTAPLAGLRISTQERAALNAKRMRRFWAAELEEYGESRTSFGRAVFKSFKTRIIIGAFISLIYALLTLANPIFVIRYFLAYLSEGEVSVSSGACYAVALALVLLLRGLVGALFWMLNYEAASRIKYGSLALLYDKLLRLRSLQDKTVGDIVNFISNDGHRLWNGIIMGPFVIGGPLILLASCVYGIIFLGPWAILSFFVILGFFPFAVVMAKLSQKFRARSIKITDKRVGLMVELLNSIKLIKMYAWELSFAKKISDIRKEERAVLERSLFVQSVSVGSSMLVPLAASCLTFIAYVATGNNLTATQAFTFVSLLNTIQASIATLPFALKAISEMVVTTRRMQEMLLMEEMKSYPKLPSSSPNIVEMIEATLSWRSASEDESKLAGCQDKTEDLPIKEKKDKKRRKKNKGIPETNIKEEKEILRETTMDCGKIFMGPSLSNLNFTLKKGSFVGVCGSLASGKTSLINALLGKLELISGKVLMSSGPVAYVPQQSWLFNGSLRDNILFGEPFDEKRYNQVVQACALDEDFASLTAGDATEVGENGSALSGGQRQRVSLARAAYSHHPLVLLDDPLSAVDVHVSGHIFRQCVQGLMLGRGDESGHCDRTVVFVSNTIEFVKECDHILVMKDGSIVEQGTHHSLLSLRGEEDGLSLNSGEYHNLYRLHQECQRTQETETDNMEEERYFQHRVTDVNRVIKGTKFNDEGFPQNVPDVVSDHNSNGMLYKVKADTQTSFEKSNTSNKIQDSSQSKSGFIEEEQSDTGALSFYVLHQWVLSMGGYPLLFLVILIFCLPVTGITAASWYLSYWIEQGGGYVNGTLYSSQVVDNPHLSRYLLGYASFIPILIILTLVRAFSLVKTSMRGSSCIHDKGFKSILYQKLAFFSTTPVGRIMNRFSADQDEMDTSLPMNTELFTNNVLQVLAAVVAVSYVSPWFVLAAIPLGAMFLGLMVIFHVCFRQLKCLDHSTRSHVLAHYGSSAQGLDSLQAYNKQAEFFYRQCQLLDTNNVAMFLYQAASRWLALRLDIVSAGVALATGLLVLVSWPHLNPALAGMALSFALQMSGLFQFTARLAVETEARFTSVQRLLEYCNLDQPEASTEEPQKGWPSQGGIMFNGVSMQYYENAPMVLKDVTFKVKPKEKIGIVGRSGAGKSSLAVALFRLCELSQGKICVDDHDIKKIPLDRLRQAFSIIPQDPVLFVGTLRYNLDPLGEFPDAELWQALEKCHISEMVKSSEHQLDTIVFEGGNNFSVGERQLFCLSRALLRKCKILILDEATAAVDSETDALIQETIKEAFDDCTMLIIAHRLTSVLLSDKILVMEAGKVQEYDTPENLTANQSSKFSEMLRASKRSLQLTCAKLAQNHNTEPV